MGFICGCGIYLFFVHDRGAWRRRSGFSLFGDFLTYMTTGPRGDGVGFLLHDGPKLLMKRGSGEGEFSFVEWGEGTMWVGSRRVGGYFF